MTYINPSPGTLLSQIHSLYAKSTVVIESEYNYMAFGTEWADGYPKGRSYTCDYPVTEMIPSTIEDSGTAVSRNISSVLKVPDTNIILVGGCRYDGNDAIPGEGGIILRSANLGESWSWTNKEDLYGSQVRSLCKDPTSGNVYAVTTGVECDVLVSTNDGVSWSLLSSFSPGFTNGDNISAVYRHTNGDYYVGVFPSAGLTPTLQVARIYKSTDGTTWVLDHSFNKFSNQDLSTTSGYYGVNRIKYFTDQNHILAFGAIRSTEIGVWIQVKDMSADTWSSVQLNDTGSSFGWVYDIIENDDYYFISGMYNGLGMVWQYTKEFVFVASIITYDTGLQLDLRDTEDGEELVFCGALIIGTVSLDEDGELDSLNFDPMDPEFLTNILLWENPYNVSSIVNGFARLD
jgi:hypothetical protein